MCAQVHKAKLLAPSRWGGAPRDGLVAVKVQYPNALETIRVAGRFLQARSCTHGESGRLVYRGVYTSSGWRLS